MRYWFTADLHLGHARICELAHRPFGSVDEMNEAIMARWVERVAPDDRVYVLGDVCMGRIADTLPLIGQLPGRKVLIPGNHDRVWPTYWAGSDDKQRRKMFEWHARYKEVFDAVHLVPRPPQPDRASLWANPRSSQFGLYAWLQGDPAPFQLAHLPFHPEAHDVGREDHLTPYRPVDNGGWLLHGHVHNAWRVNGRQINVGVDVWDFAPVSDDTILGLIRARQADG